MSTTAEEARKVLDRARRGELDLRPIGELLNGLWNQDFPAALLEAAAAPLKAAEAERTELRDIVAKCCNALPNGAYCSSEASLEFMQRVPDEVLLVMADLTAARAERNALGVAFDNLKAELTDEERRVETAETELAAARADIERLTKELATERADTFDEAASLAIPAYDDDTGDVSRGVERFRKHLNLKAKQVRALLGEQAAKEGERWLI